MRKLYFYPYIQQRLPFLKHIQLHTQWRHYHYFDMHFDMQPFLYPIHY